MVKPWRRLRPAHYHQQRQQQSIELIVQVSDSKKKAIIKDE